MSAKIWLCFAAISGAIAVMFGAFGAHGLKAKLPERLMNAYQTGVEYQFVHTLALFILAACLIRVPPSIWSTLSGTFFLLGIVFFSGSLYWLALGGPSWLGPITPLGGLAFIFAWISLLVWALTSL